jgi:hypothetical protein
MDGVLRYLCHTGGNAPELTVARFNKEQNQNKVKQ